MAFCISQHVQRCFHGNRICIVAVIDDLDISMVNDMESSANRLQCLDAGFDLLHGQSQCPADSRRCQCIEYHVPSRDRNGNTDALSVCMDRAGNTRKPQALDLIGIDRLLSFHTEKYRFDAFYFLDRIQLVIVPI